MESDRSSSDDLESEVDLNKKPMKRKKAFKPKPKPVRSGESARETDSTTVAKAVAAPTAAIDDTELRASTGTVKMEPSELPPPPPSLTQDTHPSFFSLLREIVTASDGALSEKQLIGALTAWNSSPIAALNEWSVDSRFSAFLVNFN